MAIKHGRDGTLDNRPVPLNLETGQLVVNYAEGSPGVFARAGDDTLIKIGPIHIGPTAPNAVPIGSAGNCIAEAWLDTSGTYAIFKIWDGSVWHAPQALVDSNGITALGISSFAGAVNYLDVRNGGRIVLQPNGADADIALDIFATGASAIVIGDNTFNGVYIKAGAGTGKLRVYDEVGTYSWYIVRDTLTANRNIYLPDGDVTLPTGTLVAQDGDNLGIKALNNGPLAGFRNVILNGRLDIWQRGTSFTNPAAGAYLADRWGTSFNGSGATRTLSQQPFPVGQTDVPGNPLYFIRFDQTVGGSGATFTTLFTRTEGVHLLAGREVTVSFSVKAGAAGVVLPAVTWAQNFGSGGSSQVQAPFAQNIAITTSWQRLSYTTTLPSISGKTVGTGNFLTISIRVPDNAVFTVDFAAFQLELGSHATPLEIRPLATELAACQRYYEVSGGNNSVFYGNVTSGGTYGAGTAFAAVKRTTPTVTLTNSSNTSFSTSTGTVTASSSGFLETRVANATGAGTFISTWTATAEL